MAELEVRHALLDGTSRQERRGLAERRSEVALDDQDLPSLIVRAVDHASMMKFFDADGSVPGGWGAYFEGHELVVMARILVLDPGLLEEGFSRDWRLRRARVALCEVEVLQFGEMTDSVLGLAQRMDLWGLRLRHGVSSPAGHSGRSFSSTAAAIACCSSVSVAGRPIRMLSLTDSLNRCGTWAV